MLRLRATHKRPNPTTRIMSLEGAKHPYTRDVAPTAAKQKACNARAASKEHISDAKPLNCHTAELNIDTSGVSMKQSDG